MIDGRTTRPLQLPYDTFKYIISRNWENIVFEYGSDCHHITLFLSIISGRQVSIITHNSSFGRSAIIGVSVRSANNINNTVHRNVARSPHPHHHHNMYWATVFVLASAPKMVSHYVEEVTVYNVRLARRRSKIKEVRTLGKLRQLSQRTV